MRSADPILSELTDAALAARDDHGFRVAALKLLCASLSADTATLISFGGVLPREVLSAPPAVLHQYTKPSSRTASAVRDGAALVAVPFLNHYCVFRERFDRELQRGWQHAATADGLFLDQEAFPADEWQRTAIYGELFSPHGIERVLGATLLTPHGCSGVVLVGRHDARAPFVRAEVSASLHLLRLIGMLNMAFAETEAGPAEQASPSAAVQQLSFRERRMAEMISHGMTNREIATALSLSPNTVRNQIAALFAKLGVRNRSELVSWAFEHSALKRA